MAVLNQAKYLSFDHQYVETVVVTDAARLAAGVYGNRFVNRSGGYPAENGYAAGVSLYDIFSPQVLTGYDQITLTGTVAIAATTGVVTGSSTVFTTELSVGAVVKVVETLYTVVSIASNTSMVVALLGGGTVSAVSAGATMIRMESKGGYGINPPNDLSLHYEDRLNPSTTPYAPRIFPYQRQLSIVTTGIAIVQVAPSQTIVIDSPIAVGTEGRAKLWTSGAGNIITARSLDSLTTGASDTGYIRVKLGNEGGAY